MAASTGIVLITGAIVLTNDVLVNNHPLEMKVVLAIGFTAVGLAALEHFSPELATGIAYIALITALVAPIGGRKSPLESILHFSGFA